MIYKQVTVTVSGTTGKGHISNDDSTWGGCYGAASGDSNGTGLLLRSERSSGNYQVKRCLLPVDTSSIPVYAYILSAKLQLYLTEKINNIGNGIIYIVSPTTQASLSSISNADFNDCGGSTNAYLENAYLTLNAYNDFIISNPNSVIQKASTTKFGIREYWEYTGTFPTSQNTNSYVFENGDGTNKPKLVITYALYGTMLPMTF